jgi:hypothetical protein
MTQSADHTEPFSEPRYRVAIDGNWQLADRLAAANAEASNPEAVAGYALQSVSRAMQAAVSLSVAP